MKLSDWAEKQGITYRTAWQWFKNGTLPVRAIQTPTGTILVEPEAIREIDQKKQRTVIYARVSSSQNKDNLQRQVERVRTFCIANGWVVTQEVGSGLNDKLKKLISILRNKPDRIVVEHKDRLTRFGFNYFDELLPMLGIELVVVNRDLVEENDLVKDLIAIVTSFCCRLYGARRGKNKNEKIKKILGADDVNGN